MHWLKDNVFNLSCEGKAKDRQRNSKAPAPLTNQTVIDFVSTTGYELRLSSRTSSASQHVQPDDPVVENGHDSSRSPGSTIGLSTTQLNSTQLDCRAVEPALNITSTWSVCAAIPSRNQPRPHAISKSRVKSSFT